jgi:hypothetical protein
MTSDAVSAEGIKAQMPNPILTRVFVRSRSLALRNTVLGKSSRVGADYEKVMINNYGFFLFEVNK